MAETSKIALMANKVSSKVFSVFGWKEIRLNDQNWDCATPERHEKITHPSDVVFYYDAPYRTERVYVTTDLKSYGITTIKKTRVAGAISSLVKATECANTAEGFKNLYVSDDVSWSAVGLLFVMCHDTNCDGYEFGKLMSEIADTNFAISTPHRAFVLGPDSVSYLATVANDILVLRGQGVIPEKYGFFYPDLVTAKSKGQRLDVASLEMLTSPIQVLTYSRVQGDAVEDGYIIYYRGPGESPDEFRYLIDFLFRYQLLRDDAHIRLRLKSSAHAAVFFRKAVAQTAEEAERLYGITGLDQRLSRVECQSVDVVLPFYSDIELGLGNGE